MMLIRGAASLAVPNDPSERGLVRGVGGSMHDCRRLRLRLRLVQHCLLLHRHSLDHLLMLFTQRLPHTQTRMYTQAGCYHLVVNPQHQSMTYYL